MRSGGTMRLISISSILATLMCGAAIGGYLSKAAPDTPQVSDARWYASTGTFECEGQQFRPKPPPGIDPGLWDPIGEWIRAGQLVCKYPSEATFRDARTKAVGGPEAELRRALDRVALSASKRDAILDGTDADARGLSPAQRQGAVIAYQDIANFRVQQALWCRQELSRVEATFDEEHRILQGHWARTSESALITRMVRMLRALERGAG